MVLLLLIDSRDALAYSYSMDDIKNELIERGFTGDLDDTAEALAFYSHDASMFELVPKLVIKPKNTKDVETAVKLVAENKKTHPDLSLTARSAGTDMSGAAINESIIVDFNAYFREILSVKDDIAVTQPGVFFRDFDVATGDYLLPSYPASRDLASVGGMLNNNSGGERSLEFGKTEKYVPELK